MTGSKYAALAIALILVAPAARADEKAAIAHFEEGRKLVREGHYGAAVPPLLASLAEEPSVGALLNLADCYENLGKTASAFVRFRDAERLAIAKNDKRSLEARARASALEPRLSRLAILVPDAARVRDMEVRRDGEPVPDTEWDALVAVDPGVHTIEVKAAGYKTRVAQVNVISRAEDTVYTVTPLESKVLPLPSARPRASATPSTQQIVGLGALGAGAIALGVGTYFGVQSMGLHSYVKKACPDYPRCPPDTDAPARNADAVRAGTISTIAFVAGGALIAAGAVLVLYAPPAGPRVTARVGPTGAGLEGAW